MNTKYKRFTFQFLISIGFLLMCIMFLNYKIDAYGILTNDYSRVGTETNKNYIKTKYIIENPTKYDSFIFGSSRVEYIPVEKLNTGNFYNMTYVQGVPAEWIDTMKVFKENNVTMKNIIIAVDDFSSTIFPEEHLNAPNMLPYSEIKENMASVFKLYLLKNPFDERSRGILKNGRPGGIDIEDTGRFLRVDDEEFYKSEQHINKIMFDRPTILGSYENNRIDDAINEIKGIVDFCSSNNINLTVIFNPLHKTTYEYADKEKLMEFKNKLSQITDYWDFNQMNEITTNNYYWYETSHYRDIVGEMMLNKIFDEGFQSEIEVPNDFGVYVSKS